MIRFIFALLYTILSMIFSLPVHAYWRGLFKKGKEMESWTKSWKYVRGFFKGLIFFAGTKIEVRGKENIPDDEAVLFVGNHRSYFDIIITQTLSKNPMAFVAKKEFLKYPLLHHYMTDIGCLYLDRDNPRQAMKTIAEGTRRLEEGLSLGLFPEGTRNHGKELLPFKEGGYRMAEKSGRPIVLMALTGIDDIFENNHHMLKKKNVVIEYSEPFYPSKMEKAERKEFYVSIPGRIEEMLANVGKDGK